MNKIAKVLTCFISKKLPIKKEVVLFSSFFGQYNDNPKAISEELKRRAPHLDIVWVKSSKSREEFPVNVRTVEAFSKEYYKLLFRSQVVVDNHMGARASGYWGDKGLKKIFAKSFSKKRKGQFCISTWHGTPLKRIAADVIGVTDMKRHYTNSDYVVAGCTLTKNALESAYLNSVQVKMYGTPRNDVLVNNNLDLNKLKEKLQLPRDKKIILFAPTFRDTVENSGVIQMKNIDFNLLFQTLEKRFGGEWCFVFRVHNNVLLKIDVQNLVRKYGERIVNGNLCDDMAEYLLCADALITDYSGSMFDFALTKKPCFLYAHDKEDYQNRERGFYLDYDKLPFPTATDANKLYEKIEKFDQQEYSLNVKKFLEDIGNVEDGKASQRIVDDILVFIDNKRETK